MHQGNIFYRRLAKTRLPERCGWWILVIVFLVGVLLNVIKDLKRVDHKKFLANKPELPPHRDFNDKWDDDDDWPKKDQPKK
jgi:hypothetical protein